LLGDEGSGFWLGREYLKTIYQRRHDLDTIRKFAKHATPISEIASLAKKIIEQAFNKGDRPSKKLVVEAQQHLRSLALDVASQLKWKGKIPLKLVGGLFHNPDFKKKFIRKLPRNRFQII
jgi:N-acetylglucosamine kinase-like BadF-type ATPase